MRNFARVSMLLLVTSTATADDSPGPGVVVSWDGGITGFARRDMQDASTWGTTWGARVVLRSRRYIALETSLTGSATTLGGAMIRSGTLDAQTIEETFRLALRPRATWTPYAFAGIGIQRAVLDNATMNAVPPNMRTLDYAMTLPAGAGIAIRLGDTVVDIRGAYRSSRSTGIVPDASGRFAPLDAWEVTAALGAEL